MIKRKNTISRNGYKAVVKVLSYLFLAEAAIMLIPLILSLCEGGKDSFGFAISIIVALVPGITGVIAMRGEALCLWRREGILLVSLAWIIFSSIGMIPFMLMEHPLSLADAFFETMSGFTTTGATTIANVEELSHSVLLWRSLTQWLGGLGIVLFVLAILPQLNEKGGIPLYVAEATGITHDKIHPRIRRTAGSLWIVYLILTVTLFLFLWAGPMDFFDAVCHTLSAVSTGGFSTKNTSIAYWNSDYISLVLAAFMFLGGVNFPLIFGALHGRWKVMFHNDVLRAYSYIVLTFAIAFAVIIVAANAGNPSFHSIVVEPFFHVITTITTTGYSLSDFSAWGPLALLLTMTLMLSGACAGSTTGAMKIDRSVALWRNMINEVKRSLFPHRVLVVRVNGGVIESSAIARILAFITGYLGLGVIGAAVTCAFGVSFEDSLFASFSCIGNNGLGYGLTGVAGGFHLLPEASKWIMSLLMLIGRLEIFSIVLLFLPGFWKK